MFLLKSNHMMYNYLYRQAPSPSMSNKIWPRMGYQHMNSFYVKNLCHTSDCWSQYFFYSRPHEKTTPVALVLILQRKGRWKNNVYIPSLHDIILNSSTPWWFLLPPPPHHLFHEIYDCNTSSAAIALTATPSATSHPLCLIRFAVFSEIWHHFYHGNFVTWCPWW